MLIEDEQKLLDLATYYITEIDGQDWRREVVHYKNSKLIIK